MSEILTQVEAPIVAIAYQDFTHRFHIIYPEEPLKLSDIDFQDDYVRVGDFYLVYDWMQSVIVCTEQTLKDLTKELLLS